MMCSTHIFGQVELGGEVGYHHSKIAKAVNGKSYDGVIFGITSSWKIRNQHQ